MVYANRMSQRCYLNFVFVFLRSFHLSFSFWGCVLFAAVDCLKALQEGKQRSTGALGGALIVHLSGAALPQAQQQQNRGQQLTAGDNRE